MRTTVRLDDALFLRAKREAARRGVTLTALIQQGLRLVLARPAKPAPRRRVELPVCRAGGGVLPGVDLDSGARPDGRPVVILPDVNVLIYAFRSDARDHRRYRDWLSALIQGPEAYAVAPQVLCATVRVTTHPRIFARPSRLQDAFAFARTLLSQPNATVITPGERHLEIFEALCGEAAATGNLIQDAWFAALAIEAGCEWVTTDRDYARFPGLRWRTPW